MGDRKYYKETPKKIAAENPELVQLRRELTTAILSENEKKIRVAEKNLGTYLLKRKRLW